MVWYRQLYDVSLCTAMQVKFQPEVLFIQLKSTYVWYLCVSVCWKVQDIRSPLYSYIYIFYLLLAELLKICSVDLLTANLVYRRLAKLELVWWAFMCLAVSLINLLLSILESNPPAHRLCKIASTTYLNHSLTSF